VKPKDVRSALLSIPVPDELEAQRRGWRVVEAAFAERERITWPRRHARPLLAFAVLLAFLAAALTPPGRAVVREVREAIGVDDADPALFALPDSGRLLVQSEGGPWIVRPNGAKRLLGSYREASWSPSGRYVVAARENELFALEPDGTVRWSLAKRNIRLPRWGGNEVDTRIAYLSGSSLRVVAGDGSDDRRLARRVASVAPAWKPFRRSHVLAFAEPAGRVRVVDVDSGRLLWRSGRTREVPKLLLWSADGRRLLWIAPRSLRVFDARGRLIKSGGIAERPISAAVFAPRGHRFAAVRSIGFGQSEVVLLGTDDRSLTGRQIFSGRGRLGDVAWSPDGSWLIVSWDGPNQWVFLRTRPGPKIRAVDNVSEQFGGFRSLAGWCCP
jgi:WD40 repeat protein